MGRQRLKVEKGTVLADCGTALRVGVAPPFAPGKKISTGGENRVAGHAGLDRDASSYRMYQALKRGLDVLGSLVALLLFAPLFVAIAVAINLTSAGPVLFRQERFGDNLEPFMFYKFRSMYVNCDEAIHKAYVTRLIAGCPDVPFATAGKRSVQKMVRDPRVTPLGKILRRSSLDELPQLWNVLRGDMSLVGPRPCLRYELEQYSARQTLRLIGVKPGITGLWQVSGRSTLSFDEMVKLDLVYVKERSLWLDIKILLRTPLAVISGVGAW
jgi:lipopolysaccharide/colanic/teichoic acid biosynthesis glycosyltransferase